MIAEIKSQLAIIPSNPGIYKFIDANERIIYIGKAKNLKKRVLSYFSSKAGVSGRIKIMVNQIARIEYIVVETESEALLLENSLIKKVQPKYNVRLKDGKTYPFIAIRNENFPRVFSTRTLIRDGSEYFGPFVSGLNKNYLLDMLQKNFFIRTCNFNLSSENILKGKFRLCLRFHINLCKGPCEKKQNKIEYDENIFHVKEILKGKTNSVITYFRKEMKKASEILDFEKANELKNIIHALENYQSKSIVVNPKINNVDVYSIFSTEKVSIVNYLGVSNGAIIQVDTIEYHKKLQETDEEIISNAILELRNKFSRTSKTMIVSKMPAYQEPNLKYEIPQSGDKKKLLELSYKNALMYYREIESKKILQQNKSQQNFSLLLQVKKDLDLKNVPRMIECFDNSNIQGSFPVAAMTVFKDGKPLKSAYRHYNIKTVVGPDDFASMEEVISRRYKRLIDENLPLPNLIVIDGGKGQLNAAYEVIENLGIADKIDIIGIAKKLEEIFKPGDSFPLGISKKSPSNKLIQQIRNEAHRFGITHHRTRRIRGSLVTELNNINGIGPESIKKLLSKFKSVKKISTASFDEIAEVTGNYRAKLIKDYFI